ncbi:MAG: SCO family protein [Thermomicrobiales bacterium]|nr:SCO family protein [Thermomicrobiales bacterium]
MMRRLTDNRIIPIAGVLLLLLLIAGGALFARQRSGYAFNGGEFTPPQPAPELALIDADGEPFSFADRVGTVQLLYFGYTTCPDLCPTTLLDFATVKEDLGPDADRVRFLMASVDPERDTAERLQEYMGFFDPDFIGLRGDAEETAAAAQAFGVTVKRVEHPESSTGYLIDHTALIYVIDQEGRLRLSYPYGTDPALIAADVRHLLNG